MSKMMKNNAFTWEDIKGLKEICCGLPLILKGIHCKEDALLAREHKVDAIWVSNHGGRQLDTIPASIEVLEECVEAVRGSGMEVYFDGGVRRGTDVFKALALGANCVFIGRPVLYGLAVNGQAGVEKVLTILNDELK
jgi:(S)-2-hydroxy-acid oxidase